MHLIYILVIAVSCLTIMSALALIFGSSKAERRHSLWFLAAAIGEVIWGVSIAIYLSLGTGSVDYDVAPWLIKGIYVGAILMDSMILGYVSWKYRYGKVLTSLFIAAGAVLSTIFLYDPSVLYSSFTLSNTGNYISIDMGKGFYVAYIVYFCTLVPAFCLFLIYRIQKATSRDAKKGYLFFLIGLAIAGGFSLVFDLILPMSRYDLIWVGPLLIGLTMMGFYYAVLRYRMIQLSTGWLKLLSSVVIVSGAIILYLLIFHLVFSAMFKVANPSFQVILLNFIMIAIALLLAPAISETMAMVRSLITMKQIDIAYIVKRITSLNRKRKLDYKEIAGFLAEHMHFDRVGFLVNGKFYGSADFEIAPDELVGIEKLRKPEHGVWQSMTDMKGVRRLEISRIGVLTNSNGDAIGQVIFGKPVAKTRLDRKDLTEIEMVLNLMAVVVENGGRIS